MKVYFALLLISTITLQGVCQQHPADPVIEIQNYPQKVHDSIYYELFKTYRTLDLQKAKHYAFLCFGTAYQLEHHLLEAKASNALGSLYALGNQIDSALYYYYKSVRVSINNKYKERLMYTYNGIGRVYERIDIYDSALYYFSNSKEIAIVLNSFENIAISENNIGSIYYNVADYEEALTHYEQALDIKIKHNIKEGINLNLLNIVNSYNDLSQYDNAIKKLNEVEINCKSGCDQETLGDLKYALGYSCFKKGMIRESLSLFEEALTITRKGDNKQTLAHTLYHLSEIAIKDHSYDTALAYLKEAEKISFTIRQKRIRRDVYEQLACIYDKTGILDKAVFYQKLYSQVKDSIFNQVTANNIRSIELADQQKETDAIIQQKNYEIRQSRLLVLLATLMCCVVFVVVFLAFRHIHAGSLENK